MSEYLKPIIDENDLVGYENYLEYITDGTVEVKAKSVLEKLINKKVIIKIAYMNNIYTLSGVLKEIDSEYIVLYHNNGKKTIIFRPETIVSVTIL